MHKRQAFTFDFLNHDTENPCLLLFVLREEHQSRTVFPFFRNRNALQQNEFMRNLHHDAGTVTGLVVGTLRSTVLHVFQNLQGRIDQLVRLVAVNIYNHPHSAGIMLVLWTVKSGTLRPALLAHTIILRDKNIFLHRLLFLFNIY